MVSRASLQRIRGFRLIDDDSRFGLRFAPVGAELMSPGRYAPL